MRTNIFTTVGALLAAHFLVFLTGCANSSNPARPHSFDEAQHQCDALYPMTRGTMYAQAACIKMAVHDFGYAQFGRDMPIAAKMADARLILWKQVDDGRISVADAQVGLVAYGNEVTQSADVNTIGDRLSNRITAHALYNY